MIDEIDYPVYIREILLHLPVYVLQDPHLLRRILLMTVLIDLIHVQEYIGTLQRFSSDRESVIDIIDQPYLLPQ